MTREGAAAADPTTAEIAAEWAGWVRENLIAGAPPREVVEALVSEGLGGERARFEVSQAALEPATRIGRLAARRLELFGELRSRLDRVGSQRVARVATLDADAFYDELCYMMLHQMAAPNSPQWFNTGPVSYTHLRAHETDS